MEKAINSVEPPSTKHPPQCVHVIDDNVEMRKALHFLLAGSSITAWPYASAVDFLDQLPELVPAPILLDVQMPKIDGLQLLAILKDRAIDWPVIVMTAEPDISIAVQAMKLGAIDFLKKPFKTEILDQLLPLAFSQLALTEQTARQRADARGLLDRLSKREGQIVTMLIGGIPNKTVAYRLDLSPRTVEMHRFNALKRLEVKTLAEVVSLMAVAERSYAHPLVVDTDTDLLNHAGVLDTAYPQFN